MPQLQHWLQRLMLFVPLVLLLTRHEGNETANLRARVGDSFALGWTAGKGGVSV